MKSNSFFPETKEFENNNIKECPFCNAILALSEYKDHIFCHRLDEQENGLGNYNVNNYGIQLNNNQVKNEINLNNNTSKNINSQNNNRNNNNQNVIEKNNNIQNNEEDNDFFLFPENQNNNNNINQIIQPNISQELQNLNHINFINENRSNNNINNININNNLNNNNQENNQESIFDKVKNNVMNLKSYIFQENKPNINQKDEDLLNAPFESLSPAEKEKRNKLEEQRAYEKKILGIAKERSVSNIQMSNSEKIGNFFQNNADSIFAVIDIIGCLQLHGPSIGRTINRVHNYFINNNRINDNNGVNHVLNNNQEYENFIRSHPELRNKDRDITTIIRFLPVSEVKDINNNANQGNDPSGNNRKCVICLSEFEIGDQVSALPCAHVFHNECIISWLKKHCQCPICKFNITLRSLIGF